MTESKPVLWIERLVPGGDGLAELAGLKVFVRSAAPQEKVRVRIVERHRDYAVAEIVEVLEPSPLRVAPPCRYYGPCGGCQLQHISYQGQLVVKKLLVNDALQRVGKVFVPVHNIANHSQEWHYRNKTQFPVATHIGFYRRRSHEVLAVEECRLHPPQFDQVRATLAQALARGVDQGYDETGHQGNIRHLIVRRSEPEGKMLVIVVTRTRHLAAEVVRALARTPDVTAVVQSINPARTNRILGPEIRPLTGQPYLFETVLDKRLRVSAQSFFQVNLGQAEVLCKKVLKYAEPTGTETVLDLYCGVGMLSLVLAGFVKRVVGIDREAAAISDAEENRRLLGIDNAEFRCRDVESDWTDLAALRPDVVILDPPRKGCPLETLKRVA